LDFSGNSVTLAMAISVLSSQEIELKRTMKQRQEKVKQNIKHCILTCNKNNGVMI
jgi:hypothetical protein